MPKVISSIESITPFVQAIDCLLMLVCAFLCLRSTRRRKNAGLSLLAVACFLSALILLGFFLASTTDGKPLLPLIAPVRTFAYVTARLLALIELPLFIIAIILVARENARPSIR